MARWGLSMLSLSIIGLLSLLLHPMTAIRVNTIQLRASSSSSLVVDVPVFREAPERDNGSCSVYSATFHLKFKVYHFDSGLVRGKISKSVRQALDQPLNYARIYLADIVPWDVKRVIYLDSDIIVVDDIQKLWEVDMEEKVVAAPEYCHVNLTQYFTERFWSRPDLAMTFDGRKPCYFNTGVMVMDLEKWRTGEYTVKVEEWMAVQKQERIYHLGSLPPFLLVLAGNIKAVDHRWNQHGLGGDNFQGKCRNLHPGPISLLHWSGKGKPWLRLDSRRPCVVDHLWEPYDLEKESKLRLHEAPMLQSELLSAGDAAIHQRTRRRLKLE